MVHSLLSTCSPISSSRRPCAFLCRNIIHSYSTLFSIFFFVFFFFNTNLSMLEHVGQRWEVVVFRIWITWVIRLILKSKLKKRNHQNHSDGFHSVLNEHILLLWCFHIPVRPWSARAPSRERAGRSSLAAPSTLAGLYTRRDVWGGTVENSVKYVSRYQHFIELLWANTRYYNLWSECHLYKLAYSIYGLEILAFTGGACSEEYGTLSRGKQTLSWCDVKNLTGFEPLFESRNRE